MIYDVNNLKRKLKKLLSFQVLMNDFIQVVPLYIKVDHFVKISHKLGFRNINLLYILVLMIYKVLIR